MFKLILLSTIFAMIDTQTLSPFLSSNKYITTPSESLWERNTNGLWSQWIASPFKIPNTYFICGYAQRQMFWKKTQQTNCPTKCTIAEVIQKSMINGIKIIFCSIQNWNKQFQKTFQTTSGTNNISGVLKEYKCPRDTYITSGLQKFGMDNGTDLGLNGFQFNCQRADLKGTSIMIQDPSKGWMPPTSYKPKYGMFMSAMVFKYQLNGKLLGCSFGYSSPPVITKVRIQFSNTIITNYSNPYQVEYSSNKGSSPKQVTKEFKFIGSVESIYESDFPQIYDVGIQNAIIEQFQIINGVSTVDGKKQINSSTFGFGKVLQTAKQVEKIECIEVPSCKTVKTTGQIMMSNIRSQYTGQVTFVNKITGELIGTQKITGIYKGNKINGMDTSSQQSPIQNCGTTSLGSQSQ